MHSWTSLSHICGENANSAFLRSNRKLALEAGHQGFFRTAYAQHIPAPISEEYPSSFSDTFQQLTLSLAMRLIAMTHFAVLRNRADRVKTPAVTNTQKPTSSAKWNAPFTRAKGAAPPGFSRCRK